jgi:hypothetical protein
MEAIATSRHFGWDDLLPAVLLAPNEFNGCHTSLLPPYIRRVWIAGTPVFGWTAQARSGRINCGQAFLV